MRNGTSPKDMLFETAARLFYQHGYRATGVDTIAAESGIGKMTLYRHFPSKDDLIVAYLRDSDRVFWEYFEASTRGGNDAAREAAGVLRRPAGVRPDPGLLRLPVSQRGERVPGERLSRAPGGAGAQAGGARAVPAAGAGAGARQPEVLADALVSADGWRLHGGAGIRRLAG